MRGSLPLANVDRAKREKGNEVAVPQLVQFLLAGVRCCE